MLKSMMLWIHVLIPIFFCIHICYGINDDIAVFPFAVPKPKNYPNQVVSESNLNVVRLGQIPELVFGISDQASYNFPINSNVSEKCSKHLLQISNAVKRRELWALRLVDAAGKPPTGILGGNLRWYGSFDQCIRTRSMVYRNNKTEFDDAFEGQYCDLMFPLKSGDNHLSWLELFSVTIGVCFPSTCTDQDVFTVVSDVVKRYIPDDNNTRLSQVTCAPDHRSLDAKAICTIVFMCILGFIVLVATLYDVINQHWRNDVYFPTDNQDKTPITNGVGAESYPLLNTENKVRNTDKEPSEHLATKLLLAFSAYTNAKKLLSSNQRAGSLTAINGIKFFTITWVIVGHTCKHLLPTGANTELFMYDMYHRWTFQVVVSTEFSVDTFFTIGGVLLAYVASKEFEKRKWRINWFLFYFHRFWRIVPTYGFILMINATLFHYFGKGPAWQLYDQEEFCKENWWKNLLFINNFFGSNRMCYAVSWYLSCDMQFYIITPLLMIPLVTSTAKGLIVCATALSVSMITAGIISFNNDLPSSAMSVLEQNRELAYMQYYYIKPYCRVGPYIVGMLCGYLLHKTKCQVKLKWHFNLLCWFLSTSLALLLIYGRFDPDNKHPMSTEVAALFNATSRTVWSIVISWIIFACATGNAGFINTFLSWSPFMPLGRLSYCAYLIHNLVLDYYKLSIMSATYYTDVVGIFIFLAVLVTTNIMAFGVSLVLEAPALIIEKYLFHPKERKS